MVITEIMVDPRLGWRALSGEYVELTNRSAHAVDLVGATLQRGCQSVVLPRVVLQPGEATAIAGSRDTPANAGIQGVRATLDDVELLEGDRVLRLFSAGGALLDRVDYGPALGTGGGIPSPYVPRGGSLSLDPGHSSASGNDTGTHWCDALTPFGDGSFGTPGRPNDACAWTMTFAYAYDIDGDGVEGGPDEPAGTTTVTFDFDGSDRWFDTGNLGTGGLGNPAALVRLTDNTGSTHRGQELTFTYDATGVTYTTVRPFGDHCWGGGAIVDLPAGEAVSGSWTQVGCVEP